jgi:signal transduction histidine kinase/CheY-like chemotaxis protein
MSEESGIDILLVDDTLENLVALEAILSGLCHRIVKASSGREALRSLLQQDFAVILLDVNMPLMDGFETASLIRQRSRSATTPIIFVTAHGDDARLARGYSLGAVDFILTPVVPQILRAKVNVFVELFRKTSEIHRQSESLRERADQLHRLADAALAVNAADSIEGVLRALCERALDVTEAATASARADLGGGRRHFVRSGDAVLAPARGAEGARISAPLVTREGNEIGQLDLARSSQRPFSPEDRAVLVQLVQMASVAVQNLVFGEEREANRLKDEFLATVSHELRTPLSVILTWIGLLRRSDNEPGTLARGLEVMERNAKAQAQLVDELLDMSRIMTGKLALDLVPVDLRTIVDGVVDALRPEAQARSLQLTSDTCAEPLVVQADSGRMHQVLWNLLSNAIKFTADGGHVRVAAHAADGSARLVVQDDGTGIDPEFLPFVFDRFRQADSKTTRPYRGLGLGLAIVRHVAELHGGVVRAESDGKGLGARFVVELPLFAERDVIPTEVGDGGAPKPGDGHSDEECDLNGLGVLLVEDDEGSSEAVTMLLARAGATVRTAASVRAAMAVLRDWRPAVVVSDIGLPLEDGYALIRNLRALADSGLDPIPAIAMTAYAHAEERARVLAEGFDAHLAKPVDGAVLLRTLARYMAGRTAHLVPPSSPSKLSVPGPTSGS